MKVGIIGAGRIGKVHAKNISMFVPEMKIKAIADPFMNEETESYARGLGISVVPRRGSISFVKNPWTMISGECGRPLARPSRPE